MSDAPVPSIPDTSAILNKALADIITKNSQSFTRRLRQRKRKGIKMNANKSIPCWWRPLDDGGFMLHDTLGWVAYCGPSSYSGKFYWKIAADQFKGNQLGYSDTLEDARKTVLELVLADKDNHYTLIDKKPETTVMDELVEALGGNKA